MCRTGKKRKRKSLQLREGGAEQYCNNTEADLRGQFETPDMSNANNSVSSMS